MALSQTEDRLKALGLTLPEPSRPGANYVPYHIEGTLLFVTGQLSQWNGERRFVGKLGDPFTLEEAQDAARLAALNVVAQAKAALGDLDRVKTVLRVAVYVNSVPTAVQQSQVANGASDLFVDLFGESGRHTRLAVGVAALPYNVCAEVEATFAIHPKRDTET